MTCDVYVKRLHRVGLPHSDLCTPSSSSLPRIMQDADEIHAVKSVFAKHMRCFEDYSLLSPAPSAWNICSKRSVYVAGDGPVQRGVCNQAAEFGRGYQHTAQEQGGHGQGLERVPRSADGC